MNSIILASGSPRRKKLLEQINLTFRVQVSTVDEHYDPKRPPTDIVQILADRKARDIAQNTALNLVIGADTIVVYDNKILEKPKNPRQAIKMLMELSGQTHTVLTGVALYKTFEDKDPQYHHFVEQTKVTFGEIDADDISIYVKSRAPMDKAGAYGIQDDFGALFVKHIDGDYNTVVGFPLYKFYREMKNFAPEYLADNMNKG
ncbi:Maf family protein [Aliifodinibius salicampi]|uniref:dTTP/UTP pyrophosphatase n=1 Tax=Fodinibius salicampi TaxID=1920655 RepID=A0ABT3PUT0_9BACT|nr:Maf family protein [Fodinibius salicampi]MCW9711602.1 Maf family protein [Fodinibius salicampi]